MQTMNNKTMIFRLSELFCRSRELAWGVVNAHTTKNPKYSGKNNDKNISKNILFEI